MNDSSNTINFFLGGVIIWCVFTLYNQDQTIKAMTSVIEDCSYAVDSANENMDNVNSSIEDAQSEEWDDYDSMGYALEDIVEAEPVYNPCEVPDKR